MVVSWDFVVVLWDFMVVSWDFMVVLWDLGVVLWYFYGIYPPINAYIALENHHLVRGQLTGPCSIAILNYQRVFRKLHGKGWFNMWFDMVKHG